jgi:formylglycine-generating enzyme required for sulfatase activity
VLRDVADGLARLAGIQAREQETSAGARRNLHEAEQLYVWVLDRLPGDRAATFGLVGARLSHADLLRQRGDTDAAEQLAHRADAVADAWLLAHPRDEDSARALRELQTRLTRVRATPGAARPTTPERPEVRPRTPQVSSGNDTVASRPQPPAPAGTWVRVLGGGFDMGCSSDIDRDCVDDEFPRHRARVAPFEMMRTEVTVGQYRAFARGTAIEVPPQPAWSLDDRYPIVGVPWQHAQAFCVAVGARLPAEAEWEFAARGGRGDVVYPWGLSWDPARANAGPAEGDRFRAAAPVASFPPSAFGLHDMAGNVWEWVADWYNASGYGTPRTGMYRVIRGGSFGSDAGFLRVSQRGTRLMNPSLDQVGFRCAR